MPVTGLRPAQRPLAPARPVAVRMNNLYADWCRAQGRPRKDGYAFKCTAASGADKIEAMRGSGERNVIACTVDLLEAGVDIERLNAVVFFRYLQSAIKFHQMVGRGTRIHEETRKDKFWLYDDTGVTALFGTDFLTAPPRRREGGERDDGGGGDEGGGGGEEGPHVGEMRAPDPVAIRGQGRSILVNRGGVAMPVPLVEQRRIAARLKAQLAEVEVARRAAASQLAQIDQLPQKLLAQAFDDNHASR